MTTNRDRHQNSSAARTRRHQALLETGKLDGGHYSIKRRRRVLSKEQRTRWLREQYKKLLGLSDSDLQFVAALANLEVNGVVHFVDSEGEPVTRDHFITEGHKWLVDRLEPDLRRLLDAGLIRKPHINGEPRERLIHRTFFDLTPSGRDLINIDYSGEGVGDLGEGVVHRLGVHLYYWWAQKRWDEWDHELVDLESTRYPVIDGREYDVVVKNHLALEFQDGSEPPWVVAEIETDSNHWDGLEADALKLGHTRARSVWVFPNREVLVECLNELTMRGYCGLQYPVPKTLAMRNHRDTYNKRLKEVDYETSNVNYSPVDYVYTFTSLVDDLKDWRPELFYGPCDR